MAAHAGGGGGVSPFLDLSSIPRILGRSLSFLLYPSAVPAFLAAALLLLSFRSALFAATLSVSSLPDRQPALRLLLSRLSEPPTPRLHTSPPPPPRPSRDPSRDFHFSSSKPSPAPASNASHPFLFLGPAPATFRRIPTAVNPRHSASASASATPPVLVLLDEADADGANLRRAPSELRLFGRTLDLDRREASALLYLLSLLSAIHSAAILGFIVSYSVVIGIVFFAVASCYLDRPSSLSHTLHSGARLGLLRLGAIVFLKWAVRDAIVQFLCVVFLSEVADQSKLFKLFVGFKFMPFFLAASSPPSFYSGGHDTELAGFLFLWVVLDTVLSVVFVFMPWVVVADRDARRRGRDLLREGLFLVGLVPAQAFGIKFLEMMICGNMGRWVFTAIGGRMLALVIQSVAEIYFMVAWLVLYFGARCKEEDLEGRRFRLQDLRNVINAIR